MRSGETAGFFFVALVAGPLVAGSLVASGAVFAAGDLLQDAVFEEQVAHESLRPQVVVPFLDLYRDVVFYDACATHSSLGAACDLNGIADNSDFRAGASTRGDAT